jgi:hypothetical protein
VHHIVEQADGGGDELDNLIPICRTCHSDVHTNTKLTRRFAGRSVLGPEVAGLSAEAVNLLVIAAADNGRILFTGSLNGYHVQPGHTVIASNARGRVEAVYRQSLKSLEGLGLIETENDKVFRVTHAGYLAADALTAAGAAQR